MTSAAGTETYTLDALNRLTEVVYPNTDVVSYSYDANGNRLTQTVNGVTTATNSYDDADQLLSDGTLSYSYDAAGNLTTAGADSFSWDWDNRLESATASGTTVGYTYAGDDVRVGATVGGSSSPFLWDRESGLPLLVDDGTSAYLHDQFGLLAETDGTDSVYHLGDALGSVRGLTDDAGAVTGTADYSPFGEVRSQAGASSHFGFTGEWTDATTGFTHLRARDLNPALGRFLSVDTVQPNAPGTQGFNVYAYVANNPTTWVDPSGHAVPLIGLMLASNWLPIALAIASVLIADCAAGAALGLGRCPGMAVFLITIFTIVGCILEVGGPCWTEEIFEFGKRHWPIPQLRDLPNNWPQDPRGKCAAGMANGMMHGVPFWLMFGIDAGDMMLDAAMGCFDSMRKSKATGSGDSSVNQMDQEIQKGKAPKSIKRVEHAKEIESYNPAKDHVHFNDGSALNRDGTWRHGHKSLTNAEKKWLEGHGWTLPN